MNRLLIVSVLAVLPMMEGQMITDMKTCTTSTNDLRVDCSYRKTDSSSFGYEWSLITEKQQSRVIASTISSVAPTFKNRANVTKTDTLLQLTLTGFGTADNGNYTCRLRSNAEPKPSYNKTIPVMKGADYLLPCSVPGLLLNSPWMLSLLLSLTVLQVLDALPCGSEN